MTLTSQSEYLPLHNVFLHRVADVFKSEDKILKEWKRLGYIDKPDLTKASKEYHEFESLFSGQGIDVHYFQTEARHSLDAIYCRDAAVMTDHGVILGRMGKQDRACEPGSQRKTFESLGIPILGSIDPPGTLEGGDLCWLDTQTLAVGHSYRTNEEGIVQLRGLVEPLGITLVKVDLPHYKGKNDVFHLMSIISPVDKDLAVVFSTLMPIGFRNELLSRGFKLIESPEKEFESLGCNVLALGPRKCVIVSGNPITRELILRNGCEVIEYNGLEISVKGGGGPTCLTRPYLRTKL